MSPADRDRYLRKLAKTVHGLQDQVRDLHRGIGLGHSSFNGGGITQYSPDGSTPMARYGQQFDGTNGIVALNGPVPPTPIWTEDFGAAVVGLAGGGLRIRYEGGWETVQSDPSLAPTPGVAPQDFSHIEVHVSSDVGMSGLLFSTLKGQLTSARGGEVTVWLPPLDAGGYYVRLVARTNTGRTSTASAVYGPVNTLKVQEADLGFDLDAIAGNKITPSATEPAGEHKYGDLWLKLPEKATYRWAPGTPDAWVESRDAGISDAILAAEAAQAAADLRALYLIQSTAPTGLTATDKAIWVDDDDDNVSYSWNGTNWDKRQISTSSIKPNSLIARDVIATGTVSAALLEAILILATVIIAGDPNGEHTKIDSTGVAVYVDDPTDGIPNEVTRLGRQSGGIDPATGRQSWLVTEQGRASFQGLSITEDPIVQGTPLSTRLDEALTGRLVGYGRVSFPAYTGINQGELGVIEVTAPMRQDRSYRVEVNGLNVAGSVAQDDVWLHVRAEMTNQPSVSSPIIIGPVYQNVPAASRYKHFDFAEFGAVPTTGNWRLLLTVRRGPGGSGSLEVVPCTPVVRIYDTGPHVLNTGVISYGGAPAPGGGTTAYRRREFLIDSNWSRSFNGAGNYESSLGSEVLQGYSPNYTPRGNARGLIGFSDVTAALAGVTDDRIEYMELSLFANSWHYMSGGTGVFGYHDNTAPPATFNGSPDQFSITGWGRGQRRNIDLTNLSGLKAALRTGGVRGFTVGPGPSTDPIFYGRFNGAGMPEPPRLYVRYYA